MLERHACRTTDHFAGFQLTGHFRAPELAQLIRDLPEGLTEFMCHPGYCGDALRQARTRLKESRERELEALVAARSSRRAPGSKSGTRRLSKWGRLVAQCHLVFSR